MYNKHPDIDALKHALAVIEKEASWPVAGAIGSGLLSAGAQSMDTLVNLAKEMSYGSIAAAGATGIAAAYLAHKMKNVAPSDINNYRSDFYKEDLKRRIGEIRKQQTIASTQKKEPADKQPSLRLT